MVEVQIGNLARIFLTKQILEGKKTSEEVNPSEVIRQLFYVERFIQVHR